MITKGQNNINDSNLHELQTEIEQLKTEKEDLKQLLLKLWIQISKSFEEDFEEILQLGINSDIQDVLNAILLVEEARQEQIKSERQQIQLLSDELKAIKEQNNTTTGINEELKETQKQYRELSELVLQLKQSNHEKEQKISELGNENKKLSIEINQMTNKLNDLTSTLIQTKEDKIKYMEQSQLQIQLLMDKELLQSKQIQQLQIQKMELENSVRKNSSRNSLEQPIHLNCPTQKEDETRLLSCSPRTSHIDFSKIVLQSLQNKKAEMVSGSSLSQIPYRFGK